MVRAHTFSPATVLCAGLLTTAFAPACAAQTHYGYQRDYYRDVERRAYDNGYSSGLRHGERDAGGRRSFSYERHDDFRDADDGYRRGYGDREFYRRLFRQGFQAGYSAGFNHVARERGYNGYGYGEPPRGTAPYGYPSSPSYPPAQTYPAYPSHPSPPYGGPPTGVYTSPAAQIGYRDGFEVGRNDARDRESYDPVRSRRYRSGDHEYDNRFGPKDAYKREYRAAFQQGYGQGYRQYRR